MTQIGTPLRKVIYVGAPVHPKPIEVPPNPEPVKVPAGGR